MKKRSIILIGMVSLVLLNLAFGSTVQAAAPAISVSPSSVEESHGDSFTIEIKIDPEGAEIYGAQYYLYFNQNVLNASSQSQGTFLSQDGATTTVVKNEINNTVGKIEYGEAIMGGSGVTSAGTLASLTFEVVGTSGTSDLKLSYVILSDSNGIEIQNVTINHGTCTIVTGAPDTSPTPTSALTGDTSPTPALTDAPDTSPTPALTYTDITAEEAHQMLEENPAQFILLDVRTEEEYNAEHIPEAKLIPLPELEDRIDELDANKKIIVYCQTGGRSRETSEILVQNNFENVYNMLGGIDAWRLLSPNALIKPTPTPAAVTPSPVLSLSPAISHSPAVSPMTSTSPAPTSEQNGIPGFEAAIAIIVLIVISYLILKRERRK